MVAEIVLLIWIWLYNNIKKTLFKLFQAISGGSTAFYSFEVGLLSQKERMFHNLKEKKATAATKLRVKTRQQKGRLSKAYRWLH